MGMDVIGKNDSGYFRQNVWGWHPLWDVVEAVAPALAAKVTYAHSNDGDGLDAEESHQLAAVLRRAIDLGHVEAVIAGREAVIATLPRTPCPHCGATGVRTDAVGVSMGMPGKALDETTAILTGRDIGWCNGCDGLGDQAPMESNYGTSVEAVEEFAAFLSGCEGFEIW